MASLSPVRKTRRPKKSTERARDILAQLKKDISPFFCELYDGVPKSIMDIKPLLNSQDSSLATIIYLSRNLMTHVDVVVFDIPLTIIPIMIGLTSDSYIMDGKKRVVNPSRMAVYFMYDDIHGNADYATSLIAAIKINKKQEHKEEAEERPLLHHKRRIEF